MFSRNFESRAAGDDAGYRLKHLVCNHNHSGCTSKQSTPERSQSSLNCYHQASSFKYQSSDLDRLSNCSTINQLDDATSVSSFEYQPQIIVRTFISAITENALRASIALLLLLLRTTLTIRSAS